MRDKTLAESGEEIVNTTCASHCGGSCILKLHVKDGVITRIETDDGEEPQFRACLRGRAQRQKIYSPDRLLYPLKRVGVRGEGKFERISWDEALDTVASEWLRVSNKYGPASIVFDSVGGDIAFLHTSGRVTRLIQKFGGCTRCWGNPSFQGMIVAVNVTYGSPYTGTTRNDLPNSRLIIMWGWDPASTVSGVTTCSYLAQAHEQGTKIISIDPRYTDTAALFADQWIPIRPSSDTALALALAYVLITKNLYDRHFIDTYTMGFNKFKDYILGKKDGVAKTPAWAETITGVPSTTIENLAVEYASTKPAALMSGAGTGRTAYGEQYHRATMTLQAMTGNVGVHGGEAGAVAWHSIFGGFPYNIRWYDDLGNRIQERDAEPYKERTIDYMENS
ncbi:molybdopterin-dependent oxidoreductase, partial [Chloroflexota bacterium]